FLAGTGIAACCGAVGYFVVLRSQVFTGDALSHVAFTGALAALAAGADLRLGLFGATIAVAVGMGLLGRSGRADDVVIGSVFAWMLGLGVLFLSIYTSSSSGANGTAGVSVLFGSILVLSAAELRHHRHGGGDVRRRLRRARRGQARPPSREPEGRTARRGHGGDPWLIRATISPTLTPSSRSGSGRSANGSRRGVVPCSRSSARPSVHSRSTRSWIGEAG